MVERLSTGGDTRLGMTYFLSDNLALKPGVIVSFSSYVNEDKFNNTTDIETGDTTGSVVFIDTALDYYFTPGQPVSIFAGGSVAAGYGFYKEAGNWYTNVNDDYLFQIVGAARIGARYLFNESFGIYITGALKTFYEYEHVRESDRTTGATTGNDVNTSFDLYIDTSSIALVYCF
jgi:hypothetical protein